MITTIPTPQAIDISPVDAIWTIIQSQTKAVKEALFLRVEAEQRQTKAREAILAMRRQSEENGNDTMSLDDINYEIRMARQARKKRRWLCRDRQSAALPKDPHRGVTR